MSDAPALFAGRGDPEAMRWWDWPAAKDVAEVEAAIADHGREVRDGSTLWWAAALSPQGPAIGECDLSGIDRHHRSAEIGFLFGRAYWGHGYASEAMAAVLAHAFETLALERLWARIHAGNEASARLLARLGFAREGLLRRHVLRDGERRDCLLYGRLRNEGHPSPPRSQHNPPP